MFTFFVTISAAAIAILALMWLVIVDQAKPARARALARSAPAPTRIETSPDAWQPYRPPTVFTKVKALLGLGTLGLLLAVLAAVITGLALGATLFLLREAL